MVLIARVEKEFGTRCRVFEEQEREARTRENDEDRLVTMAVSVETGKQSLLCLCWR